MWPKISRFDTISAVFHDDAVLPVNLMQCLRSCLWVHAVTAKRYLQSLKMYFFSPLLQIKDSQIAKPTSVYTHLAVRQLEAACLDYSLLFYITQWFSFLNGISTITIIGMSIKMCINVSSQSMLGIGKLNALLYLD